MTLAAVLLALAAPAVSAPGAPVMGGHEPPEIASSTSAAAGGRAELEELWQRRILPPDQSVPTPQDRALLARVRAHENEAFALLKDRFGGYRPWAAPGRDGVLRLTREGFEKYLFLLTQDAVEFFESKGVEPTWAFKLRTPEGRPLFERGRLTDEGARVYSRARRNLEAWWMAPNGQVFGTRRPPQNP